MSFNKIAFFLFTIFALWGCKNETKNAESYVKNDLSAEVVISEPEKKLSPAEMQVRKMFETDRFPTKDIIMAKGLDDFIIDLENLLADDNEGLFTLVDKSHYLESDFEPDDLVKLATISDKSYVLNRKDLSLREPVLKPLEKMASDAFNEGITILVSSTYRSYDYQTTVYERNVKQLGKEEADRVSAKPGTSQHQLGTAIDFGSISDDFAKTKAGKWLDENAARYGFSLSFPEGYEEITGYMWECWHYRYIGLDAVKFQRKWFNNVQQYMFEFLYAYQNEKF